MRFKDLSCHIETITIYLAESDIVHFGTLGAHLVVLNSARAAKEILDKQSNISSDR